jgi:hypothetical protein
MTRRWRRVAVALLATAVLVLGPRHGDARMGGGGGGGGHGGFGGHGGWGHGGWSHSGGWGGHHVFFAPRFVVGGGFLYGSPFYPWPYYWGYPYGPYGWPYPYGPYPFGGYGYPPYDEEVPDYPPPSAQSPAPDQSAIPPAAGQLPSPDQPGVAEQAEAAGDDYSSYGLIQLRGVPEGATVDLDGRRWLDGHNLSGRWLALPAGVHTIAVRADGYEAVEQRIDVTAGRSQVVTVRRLRLRSG